MPLWAAFLVRLQDTPAGAPASGEAASGPTFPWPLIFGFIAIFYFVIFLPERKRKKQQEAMLAGIKKGDRVMTTSGIYATVAQASEDDRVVLQISDGVRVKFSRQAVQTVLSDDTSEGSGKS